MKFMKFSLGVMVGLLILGVWGIFTYQPYDLRVAAFVDSRDEQLQTCQLGEFLAKTSDLEQEVHDRLGMGQLKETTETPVLDWPAFETKQIAWSELGEETMSCLNEVSVGLELAEPWVIDAALRADTSATLKALLTADKTFISTQKQALEGFPALKESLGQFEAFYQQEKRSLSIPYFQSLATQFATLDESFTTYEEALVTYNEAKLSFFKTLEPPEDPYQLDLFY